MLLLAMAENDCLAGKGTDPRFQLCRRCPSKSLADIAARAYPNSDKDRLSLFRRETKVVCGPKILETRVSNGTIDELRGPPAGALDSTASINSRHNGFVVVASHT